MSRPITLMTAQWGDLDLESLCKLAKEMGYDGLELFEGAHFDAKKAAADKAYADSILATLDKYGLKTYAIATHVLGQCVGDNYEPRIDGFAPGALPEHMRRDRVCLQPVFVQRRQDAVRVRFVGRRLLRVEVRALKEFEPVIAHLLRKFAKGFEVEIPPLGCH